LESNRQIDELMPGLYVHIPFCATACPYCDFAFVVGRDGLADRYTRAVLSELQDRLPDPRTSECDTIYFGGGTPSAIDPDRLAEIIDSAHTLLRVHPEAEITAEANPNDHGKFARLREIGINRLSLGIQSTNDGTLEQLGRTHTGRDAADAVVAARKAGFENINVDAIFGGPSQTVTEWREDLNQLLALEPDHVSIYGLTIEPRTPFAKRDTAGHLDLPTEDAQAAMYEIALETTDRAGLSQYEISNYAKPGHESRHNLSCWAGDSYVGVGMSAHSFDGRTRSWNARGLNAYLGKIEAGDSAEAGHETLADDERKIEQIMLGLRTRDGVDRSLLDGNEMTTKLLSENLVEPIGDRLRLTRRGKPVADLICAELVRDL
jgi:oxygen-independent coproporphyrinogen III oxidase